MRATRRSRGTPGVPGVLGVPDVPGFLGVPDASGRPGAGPTLDRRRLLAAGLGAGLAGGLALVSGCGGDPAGAATVREYPPGQRPTALPIAGELLDGSDYDVAQWRGDVVVVNIWASWCGPCRAETSDLERVYQATRDRGVSFVGLNIRDNRDAATAFLDGRVTYPSLFDPAGRIQLGFSGLPTVGIPSTLILDRSGDLAVLIRRVVGRAELQQLVERIADESPG